METLLEILKYTVPSVIAFLAVYFILNNYLDYQFKKQLFELKQKHGNEVLPIRLQAFERMVIFLERIHPTKLLTRLNPAGLQAKEFQLILINEIKSEFEHNVSQQLYMSRQAWTAVEMVKDDLIKTINLISAGLNENHSGRDLSRAVLEHYLKNTDAYPSQKAIEILKSEIQQLF